MLQHFPDTLIHDAQQHRCDVLDLDRGVVCCVGAI